MSIPHGWPVAAACALGLIATLVLAAWLTPRRWWRRPTAGNLALVGGGTLAFGLLFAALLPAHSPQAAEGPAPPLALAGGAARASMPAAPSLRYRVVEDLNLRAAKATAAPRLAVLPAGTLVTPTGAPDGDWLRVRASVNGRRVEGWTSSLWLRRVDERNAGR
jgi:hypothetical protein